MPDASVFDLLTQIIQWTLIPLGGALVWFAKRLIDKNDEDLSELKTGQKGLAASFQRVEEQIHEKIDAVEKESIRGRAHLDGKIEQVQRVVLDKLESKVGRHEMKATVDRIDVSLTHLSSTQDEIKVALREISQSLRGPDA